MSEPIRTNPLDDTQPIDATGIHVSYPGPKTLTQIRAGGSDLDQYLPTTPLGTKHSGDATILWLGPDEWMIDGDPKAVTDALGGALKAHIDVSHRTICIEITGRRAADLINAACPLDLHPSTMPPSTVARSHFGKAAITLHRSRDDRFDLYTNRSFAPYCWALLKQSARDFRPVQ